MYPVLHHDDVQIWQASLNLPAMFLQYLQTVLVPDELQRAERFCFPKDRNQFIASRGLLRIILSRYLCIEPAQLRFAYNHYGKPVLDDPLNSGLTFNLSHSHGLALYAITRNRRIGVDIERVRVDLDYEAIARSSFSVYENAALYSVPRSMRHEAFFNCWTRKEAFIKAIGEGLSRPLDQFDVSLKPGEPATLLFTRPDEAECRQWSVRHLAPACGYTGALAVEGQSLHVQCWKWSLDGK